MCICMFPNLVAWVQSYVRKRASSLGSASFLLVVRCVSRAYTFVGDFDVLFSFILLSFVESFVESFAGICVLLRAAFS